MRAMPEGANLRLFPTADDVSRVTELIRRRDPDWERGCPLSLGPDLKWTPHLTRADGAVLTVHLASRIRNYLGQRLKRAALDREIHVAMPLEALFDEVLIEDLTAVDAQVHLVDSLSSVQAPTPVLSKVADLGISLPADRRRAVGRRAWKACREEGLAAHVKGRRLEGLVCFLLSQIEDFRVVERNLRTETEELDAVIQQTRPNGPRCWSQLGVPFIFVEAKNWSSRVSQTEVSVLRVKMQGKRRNVRLALLFAANGHTRDAYNQELRFASDELTIVLIGPDVIAGWIEAEDTSEYLERIVRRAMLR